MGMVVQNSQNQYIPKYNILASTAPSLQRGGVKPYELNIFADPTAPHPYQPDGSNRSVYLLTDHYTTRLKLLISVGILRMIYPIQWRTVRLFIRNMYRLGSLLLRRR